MDPYAELAQHNLGCWQQTPRGFAPGPLLPEQPVVRGGEVTPPLLPVEAWQDVPSCPLEEPLRGVPVKNFGMMPHAGREDYGFPMQQMQLPMQQFDMPQAQMPQGMQMQLPIGQMQGQMPMQGSHQQHQHQHQQQMPGQLQMEPYTPMHHMGYQDYYGAFALLNPALIQQAAQVAIEQMAPLMNKQPRRRKKRDEPSQTTCAGALQALRRQMHQVLDADVLAKAADLATDGPGSKALQEYLSNGPAAGKAAVAEALRDEVLRLSLHPNGCRVVQKVLEEVPTEAEAAFCTGLQGRVMQCIESQHGNHVIQKVIERLPVAQCKFVLDEVMASLDELCPHQFGCRVVQRMLEHCPPAQAAPVLDHVMRHLFSLCKEQYGNYVVQHVVEHGRPEDRQKVLALVSSRPTDLACHKYGANVVERCLLLADQTEREQLIRWLVGTQKKLQMLVHDRFANYVLQRVLDVAAAPQRREVYQMLRQHTETLQRLSFGKHVLSKLEELEPQMRR
jgi:pumilio RNA-binding family